MWIILCVAIAFKFHLLIILIKNPHTTYILFLNEENNDKRDVWGLGFDNKQAFLDFLVTHFLKSLSERVVLALNGADIDTFIEGNWTVFFMHYNCLPFNFEEDLFS